MATITTAEKTKFISDIAKYVKKYAASYGIKVHSAIIAQAILESGWGRSKLAAKYHNYFGLKCGSKWKGKNVNVETHEEYIRGSISTIRDNFRVYGSMEEGVKGYFEFLQMPRYKNLKGVTDPLKYLQLIKADGYATTYTYVKQVYKIVKDYNLTKYDGQENQAAIKLLECCMKLAKEITDEHFIYSNAGNGSTYESTRKKKNTNCAHYASIAAQMAGLLPEDVRVYSKSSGAMPIINGEYSDITKHFEVLHPRVTWKQWKPNARPGDICGMSKHMAVYAGTNSKGDVWYDAGKDATDTGKDGGTYRDLDKIHRPIDRQARKIFFVLRPK